MPTLTTSTESGGIGPDGLQIDLLIMKDDAYVATQTQELVAELLQSEDPFYIFRHLVHPTPSRCRAQ